MRATKPVTLSKPQWTILHAVRVYLRKNHISPTHLELGRLSGRQISTVHKTVGILVRKGMLGKEPQIARAIFVTPAGWQFGEQLSAEDLSKIDELRKTCLGKEVQFLVYVIDKLRHTK